jgi:hypothetical protein
MTNGFLEEYDKSKKVVYISHEYGGKWRNKREIGKIIKALVFFYPDVIFVSPVHCFGFLYKKVSYERGIEMCLELLDRCGEMWVFGRHSKGVTMEIEHCEANGIKWYQFGGD